MNWDRWPFSMAGRTGEAFPTVQLASSPSSLSSQLTKSFAAYGFCAFAMMSTSANFTGIGLGE